MDFSCFFLNKDVETNDPELLMEFTSAINNDICILGDVKEIHKVKKTLSVAYFI